MNPIHAKLKIYTYSLTALSVVSLILRLLCYLFTFDETLHYFSAASPLPTIADAVLILSLLWAATAFIFIPRDTMRPGLPAASTAAVFGASLCGFIFLFFSGRALIAYLTVGFSPAGIETYRRDLILHLFIIGSGILSAAYFFTGLASSCRRAGWRILLGFFPVIWSILTMAQVYFDFTHPMNEPTKVTVMLALIAATLALLQELRMLLDRHQPRLALVSHLFALLLCGVGGISCMIASVRLPALSDYVETFIVLAAFWLYFLARTFDIIREQLSPAPAEPTDESETAA